MNTRGILILGAHISVFLACYNVAKNEKKIVLLWGPLFVKAPVWPNMLNMPKSASAASISQKQYVQRSPNFHRVFAISRSSSDSTSICCVLASLWMTSLNILAKQRRRRREKKCTQSDLRGQHQMRSAIALSISLWVE